MSKYDTNNAMYEYANGVLKNKLNIKDHSELEIAEQEIVSLKQGRFDLKIKNFNLEDLCSIHQYLFNTIFTWAGELRKVDISKGNTRFANFEHIVSSWSEYVQPIINEFKINNDKITTLAKIIGEMNIVHPFREGNGRSIRIFIQLLAKTQNIIINWDKTTAQENLDASIAYMNDNAKPFISLLKKCIV